MNEKDMKKKMEYCIREYQKIKEENELLEQKVTLLEENNDKLVSCLRESNRIINTTKNDLQNSIEAIEDLRNLISYYEKATISLFQELENRVANIIEKEEDTKEIQQAIEQVKEDMKNLNNIII